MARRSPRAITAAPEPGGVVAAASTIALDGTSWRNWKMGDQRWQEEAWRHHDICGELRYATNWISNAVSRCRLFIAKIDKTGKPGEEASDPELQALSETMFGGPGMKAEAQRRIASQLYVAGESYIVAEEVASTTKDIWYVCSNSEVRRVGTDGVVVERSNIYGGGRLNLRKGKDLCLRVWTPHPRRYDAADSSVRPVLPVLREIEQLTKKKFAEIDSRLAGAGVLFVPMETEFPEGDAVAKPRGGGISGLLIRAAAAAIQDQSAASALVPIIAKVPGDQIANIKWQTFQTPFQAETQANLDGAVKRLAIGLDLPPEVLMGQGDTNHWSAWQIEESVIKIQIEPLLIRIADALTQGWLKPALKILKRDEEEFCVWYSTSALVVRPNREQTAKELNEMWIVSDEVTRAEANFTEDAKVGKKEYERKLALKAIALNPGLLSNEDVQKALGIDWKIEDPNAMPPPEEGAPPEGEEGGPPEEGGFEFEPGAQKLPWELPQFPDDSETPAQEAALLVGADLIVRRALERSGSRLLTRARKTSGEFVGVPAVELHTKVDVSAEQAEQLMADAFGAAPELARRVGMDPDVVTEMLSTYATSLVVLGAAHEYDQFARYVTSALQLIGHNGCGQFCRNPLHPGPCAGLPDIDIDTGRRSRGPQPAMRSGRGRGGAGGGGEPERIIPEGEDVKADLEHARDLRGTDEGDDAHAALMAAVAATYEYEDTRTGLRTEIKHVRSGANSRRDGEIVVVLTVLDADGNEVGDSRRSWRVGDDGKIHVRHQAFHLDDHVQAGGFSRRFNARAYQAYREMGAARVSLLADDTVGGAAWALEGYDFGNSGDMQNVAQRFRRAAAGLQPGPLKDEVARLVARSTAADWHAGTHPSPYEWAMLGRDNPHPLRVRGRAEPIQSWFGKDVMLGSEWEGILSISEPYRPGTRPDGGVTAAAEDAGWDERAGFLADVAEMSLAYADDVADDVPALPGLYPAAEGKQSDYAEHHHLFTAGAEESAQYLSMADELLTHWGRAEGPADRGGIVAHAACGQFCRNPLHPGPCRGWRSRLRVKKARGDITTPRGGGAAGASRALREARRRRVPSSRLGPGVPPPQSAERIAEEQLAEEMAKDIDKVSAEVARQRDILAARPMPRVIPASMTPARYRQVISEITTFQFRERRGLATPAERASAMQAQQDLEAMGHAIWTRRDPASGMESVVRQVGVDGDGNVFFGIDIYDAQGRAVGNSTRSIGPSRRGSARLEAYHAYLRLNPDVQGGGFAERYNARAYQAYAELGVARVGINADIDVGGYTWATQGFDWHDVSSMQFIAARFDSWSRRPNVHPQTRAEIRALLARSTPGDYRAGTHPTPYEFAMVGRDRPRQVRTRGGGSQVMWDGKELMLGTSWHGQRPITVAVRPGGDVPFTRTGTPRVRRPNRRVVAPPPVVATAPVTAAVDEVDDIGWEEREQFLADLAEWSLAYANAVAEDVPARPEDAHPTRDGDTDYPNNHHLISANPVQTGAFLDMAGALLTEWGRDVQDQVDVAEEPPPDDEFDAEGEEGLGGLAAHAGCTATFCRNPLHPGPCAGWKSALPSTGRRHRRQRVDVSPGLERRAREADEAADDLRRMADERAAEMEARAPTKKAPRRKAGKSTPRKAGSKPKPADMFELGAIMDREMGDWGSPYEEQVSDVTEWEKANQKLAEAAEEVVGGEFAGLTVKVDDVSGSEDFITMDLAITDSTGRVVGNGHGSLQRDADGKIVLYQPDVAISADEQGSGFATEWLTHMFTWAAESGVDRAEILANIDVGGYAWASSGWDWAHQAAGNARIARFVKDARARPDLTPEISAALDDIERRAVRSFRDPQFPTPRELAFLGRQPGQGGRDARWLGKDLMLGSSWEATMRFQP